MKFATAFLAGSLLATPAFAAPPATGPATMTTDHAHDFDFLIGKWNVHHRRLKERLAESHEWVAFEGTSELRMTMNGQGTFDDNYIGLPSGPYWAVGVRGYDPKTQTWAIWWLDARDPHKIEPPVVGNFDFQNGVGKFEGDDTLRGKPIRVRYTWSGITKDSAHWQQAFSPDGGKTWEPNWEMQFTRAQ